MLTKTKERQRMKVVWGKFPKKKKCILSSLQIINKTMMTFPPFCQLFFLTLEENKVKLQMKRWKNIAHF